MDIKVTCETKLTKRQVSRIQIQLIWAIVDMLFATGINGLIGVLNNSQDGGNRCNGLSALKKELLVKK